MLVNEFLEESAQKFPDKTAIVFQKQRLTYKELDLTANSLANALIRHGLHKQDRAAIYLDNSIESAIAIFGILKAAGIFVVINPQVKVKKIEYILNDCQVKVLITDKKHLEEISGSLPRCQNLKTVIMTDGQEGAPPVTHHSKSHAELSSFHDLITDHPSSCPEKNCIDIDLASLIYTSGTTGNPKGVTLTHLNMTSAASSVIEYLENTHEDIILNCLPLSFDYGLYQVLMSVKFGGTVVLEKSFLYPYQIVDLIIKEKITGFPLVPTIAAIFSQLKNLEKHDFSYLRYITNTAQALASKHIMALRKIFPHTRIYSMYGLTECKRVSYLPPEKLHKKPTSVGQAMPNTETYIVNEKGNKITAPGVIGELVIRGANVMKGYWNLPEETDQKLKNDPDYYEKVLYTGDLFKTDEEGDLYFISRKDDMIKTAGEMVSPREVENILYDIKDITEAAVIGIPDEILGRAIIAFAAVKKGSKITAEDIISYCSTHLENFMVPKRVEILDQLPKTSSGKISKKDLG